VSFSSEKKRNNTTNIIHVTSITESAGARLRYSYIGSMNSDCISFEGGAKIIADTMVINICARNTIEARKILGHFVNAF